MGYVHKFLIFQGGVLDLVLLTLLPLLGVHNMLDEISYGNATVILAGRRESTSFKVPKATVLALYFNTLAGVVRLLAGLRPQEEGLWIAAMLSEVIEIIVTMHCALATSPNDALIVAGDKPLTDELIPGVVICGAAALWMLANYPKPKAA